MSGPDDAVNHLVEVVNDMLSVQKLTPLYGKPNWGISFEIKELGILTSPPILEGFISDEMEKRFFHAPTISITTTPIDSDDSENHKHLVRVILSEFAPV